MQKINFQNLPSTTTPINATNLNAIQTNTENAINDVVDELSDAIDLFNDTSGSDWQAMMKNKIDYCIANINTTKTNCMAFINGGWNTQVYGYGIFSKIGTIYQLLWCSNRGIYHCEKGGTTYLYKKLVTEDTEWHELTLTSDFEQTGWDNLECRKRNGIVNILGAINIKNNPTSWGKVITTLPAEYRPRGEVDAVCRTTADEVMKIGITSSGDIITLNTNTGGNLVVGGTLFINVTYIVD